MKSFYGFQLNGFIDKYHGAMATVDSSCNGDQKVTSITSQFLIIESLFDVLTNFDKDGRILITQSSRFIFLCLFSSALFWGIFLAITIWFHIYSHLVLANFLPPHRHDIKYDIKFKNMILNIVILNSKIGFVPILVLLLLATDLFLNSILCHDDESNISEVDFTK